MLYKISNNIYYSKHRYMYLEPAIGYIRGNDYSIMVDAGNSPSQVEKFFQDLRTNNLPYPKYIILTHHHWDHSFGAHYASLPLVATDKCAKYLKNMSTWQWDHYSMDDRVRKGVDLEFSYGIIKKIYSNTEDIKVKRVDLAVTEDITFDLGNMEVVCYNNDNSHSDDSFLIYIPKEKIIFIGDSHSKNYETVPMSFDQNKLKEYINLIRKIDFQYAIPGHGNIISKDKLIESLENEYFKIRG